MTSESVATTTGPTFAAWARRITCTIIGWPAMSASGFPGNRVEAIRAGMRTRMSAILSRHSRYRDRQQQVVGSPVIRVARGEANRLFVRRRQRRPPVIGSFHVNAMDSFELNKILGAILGTCLLVLAVN